MIEIEKVAENLFDKIRSRFPEIRIGDDKAKNTIDPTKARIFNFDFSENFDNITISLIDENNLKIYYDLEAPRLLDPAEKSAWYKFIKNLRFFAQRNGLTYDVRDIAKSGLGQSDLKHLNKDAEMYNKDDVQVTEARMFGTRRSSYQKIGEVRIIARHSKPIVDDTNPRARGQNIQAIYIENSLGERFRLPEGTTLNGARAYARHVKNGGTTVDDFGQHITKLINEMNSLKLFVRNMRGRQFEDAETSSMVESAIDHYGKLHRDLFTIKGQRGYEQYKSLWKPEIIDETDIDMDELRDRFVRRVFDDRLMDALPIVRRAYLDKKNKVSDEFESWANSIIAEMDGDNEDDGNVDSPLANGITNSKDSDGNFIDNSEEDGHLAKLFTDHGFEFHFQDGAYYFDSNEEMERAKDIIAAHNPNEEMPKMGVTDPGYGIYGAAGNDNNIRATNGINEELSLIKRLSGLTK